MGFVACRRCDAQVPAEAGRCGFCGAAAPGGWRPELRGHEVRASHVLMAAGGAIGGALVLVAVGAALEGAAVATWAAAVAIWSGGALGAFGGLSCGAWLGGWLDDEVLYPPGPRPLRAIEAAIVEREARLREALSQIEASRKRLTASVAPDQAAIALQALDAAERASRSQLDRYAVERWRIDLLLWRNRLEPIDAGWRRADPHRCEAWLTVVLEVMAEGAQLRQRMASSPLVALPGAAKTLARLDEALAAAELLRQALVLRQAAALAEATPGIADAFDPATIAPDLGAALDGLALRVEVGRLLDVLPLLEEERARLDAELAAIEEVVSDGAVLAHER